MSIKVDLIRSGDTRLIRVEVRSDYSKNYDFATVSFVCGDQNMEIISTSSGKVVDNQIEISSNIGNMDVYVEYCTQGKTIECLIGYYRNQDLIHHENLTNLFDNNKGIQNLPVNVPELKSIRSSFEKRLDDFQQVADRFKSSWNVRLEHHNDFLLNFVSKGVSSTMLCFGELSEDILASDYVFSVNPEVDQLYIPVEVFNHKYVQYSSGCKLGIFELIKPDFIAVADLYHKTLISETISLHEIVGNT